MSGLGMFAAALGGAAGAINQQATGDIEQQRKTDLMQVAAELERSKLQFAETLRQGGVRADFNFANDKGTVATLQATKRSNTLAAGQDTRDATVAANTDQRFQDSNREQANRESLDAAARERAKTTAAAEDKGFMKASKAIKLNDPEVAQRIATARASAAESGAHTGMLGIEQARAKRVASLLDDADKILSDKTITSEEERAKQFAVVQRRIALLDPKFAAGAGRNPELDTQTEEVTRINPDGSTSKTTSKSVRKPGSIGADAGSGPAVGHEVNGFVFKGGNPNDKNNWVPKAQNDQQGRGDQAKPAVSPKQAARDEYLRELKVLDDMRSGLLMPTPQGNERQIADQEEKVNRLLRAAN